MRPYERQQFTHLETLSLFSVLCLIKIADA